MRAAPPPPVYVVRHGLTDWNEEGRLQGMSDISLNAAGRAQARANGKALQALPEVNRERFRFVASPLSRTVETMELMRAAMNLAEGDYAMDERLKEMCFGDWEGRTLDELAAGTPDRVRRRGPDKWNFLPPGDRAESYAGLCERVAAWLNGVDRPTVCVTHGGVIRVLFHLVARLAGNDAARLPTPHDRIVRIGGGVIGWIAHAGVTESGRI